MVGVVGASLAVRQGDVQGRVDNQGGGSCNYSHILIGTLTKVHTDDEAPLCPKYIVPSPDKGDQRSPSVLAWTKVVRNRQRPP